MKHNKKGKKDKNGSHRHQGGTPLGSIACEPNLNQDASEQADNERKHGGEVITFWIKQWSKDFTIWNRMRRGFAKAEWWLVIGTFALAWFAASTLKEITKSSERDQRAWLGVETVKFLHPENARDFRFLIILRNSGKTPALGVSSIEVANQFPPHSFPSNPEYPKANPDAGRSSGAIFPNEPLLIEDEPHFGPEGKDANEVLAGRLAMFTYGTIVYKDIFGKHHWTHFCWRMVLDPSNQARGFFAGPTYNDTDDEPQK